MSFIPYSCQSITQDDVDAVTAVLRSEFLTQGPVVPQFESEFARLHSMPHAIAVSNATAALHIGCLALGVGPDSLVWTSPNSFLASANCARYCGASVDFVDIDPITRNMSVERLQEKLESAARSGQLPDVVVPVDFAGLPCDLQAIGDLARRYGFKILEDASHATGASYQGHPIGSRYADITVFSFHAVKIVTTAEGGIATTHDPDIAHRLRLLRSHGMTREPSELKQSTEGSWCYEQHVLGYNYRMTELQAALGVSQLKRLSQMRELREALASRYDEHLASLPLVLPARLPDRVSSWHLYAVEIDEVRTAVRRGDVFDLLRRSGIGVNVHYIPIHTQPYYARMGFKPGSFPASEHYYSRALSIPLFPSMTEQQQDFVVDCLAEALR